jgi:hypothetical protein
VKKEKNLLILTLMFLTLPISEKLFLRRKANNNQNELQVNTKIHREFSQCQTASLVLENPTGRSWCSFYELNYTHFIGIPLYSP